MERIRKERKEVAVTDYYLTDERWALIAPHVPGKEGDPGCHGRDNRLFIEAVFWIVRTGSSWRKLPPHFGKWYTNYTRFRRWTQKRVWPDVLNALAEDEACQYFYEAGAIHYGSKPHDRLPAREDPADAGRRSPCGVMATAPETQCEMGRREQTLDFVTSIGAPLERVGARAGQSETAQREAKTAVQELSAALERLRSDLEITRRELTRKSEALTQTEALLHRVQAGESVA